MPIEQTPPLLVFGSYQEYVDRLKLEYHNKTIVTPEGKKVVFFLEPEYKCSHFLCGDKGSKINNLRAQNILFIRYILENLKTRVIKRHLPTNRVVFYSDMFSCVIICAEIKNGNLVCFTYHPVSSIQKKSYVDQNIYIDIV